MEEKMVERWLEEVQNILGRRINLVGQICRWKEVKDSAEGGAVEGERRNTILMSNN